MTRVEIRNNATGEVRDCSGQFKNTDWSDLETEIFMWEVGNSACDCNRADFFVQARNEFPFDIDRSCGDSRFSVRLTAPDAARIYSDFAEDQ